MKNTLVLYPTPAIGHLISMVELGKFILKTYPSFSITILISTPPYNAGSTTPYINKVAQTTPIHFHHLPDVTLETFNSPHHETLTFELLRLNNPLVHQALVTISQTSNIKALVMDMFCAIALQVSNELNIPTYFFYTSGLAALALLLYFPTLHQTYTQHFKDLKNTLLDVPAGIPSILATDMPKPMLDRNDKAYEQFLYCTMNMPKAQGIIVNSFDSLEPRALKALRDGLCVKNGSTPPLYCMGPLIADRDGNKGSGAVVHECLSWLDEQPSRSVVFLCFGSLGLFSEAQIKEIAIGLEKSEQRFLWVVRSPPTDDKNKRFLAPPEPDLDVLLPQGFLDRTKDRGLVVKSWAPQVEVLGRESVGGFVSHCGWNSVLEAVCAGVPMVAWPLYAEQRINRVFLVEELKLALPMVENEDGFVSAGEIEKRVKQLMDSEEGKVIREQALRMCEGAKAALSEGGSSLRALNELVELLK
ncbi:hypothetical protein IFM89_027535 [Coptis chinensis]|uniref:Glycosyltransferase n=1 Tax=Coptis chinensis TaxID=261450 RepID=A0A835HP46_9MAGN|nr:hypothetical protein IFM89_027535 [Coptis chinensis]